MGKKHKADYTAEEWAEIRAKARAAYAASGGKWAKAYYAKNRERLKQYARERYSPVGRGTKRVEVQPGHPVLVSGVKKERQRLELAGRPRPEKCELCGGPPVGRGNRFCFDHCHRTGLFRGWICQPCNLMLGFAADDAARLRAGADYLEHHKLRAQQLSDTVPKVSEKGARNGDSASGETERAPVVSVRAARIAQVPDARS